MVKSRELPGAPPSGPPAGALPLHPSYIKFYGETMCSVKQAGIQILLKNSGHLQGLK